MNTGWHTMNDMYGIEIFSNQYGANTSPKPVTPAKAGN